MKVLAPEPLTKAGFAAYGAVLETDGADHFLINQGTTTRFHALADVETDADGHAILSIFRGTKCLDPQPITMLERHPLGSQAFMPLSANDWLIVVADRPSVDALRCFLARGNQGVQYGAGVWHHPLLVLHDSQDFLVVDRAGPGDNLEEVQLVPGARILSPPGGGQG